MIGSVILPLCGHRFCDREIDSEPSLMDIVPAYSCPSSDVHRRAESVIRAAPRRQLYNCSGRPASECPGQPIRCQASVNAHSRQWKQLGIHFQSVVEQIRVWICRRRSSDWDSGFSGRDLCRCLYLRRGCYERDTTPFVITSSRLLISAIDIHCSPAVPFPSTSTPLHPPGDTNLAVIKCH